MLGVFKTSTTMPLNGTFLLTAKNRSESLLVSVEA